MEQRPQQVGIALRGAGGAAHPTKQAGEIEPRGIGERIDLLVAPQSVPRRSFADDRSRGLRCAAADCRDDAGRAGAGSGGPTIPRWFLEDIDFMTRDGGRWIAENADITQPYQQWGMEWRAAPDGTSMTGRLYGFANEEQSDDFFQFRQFWHPGEQRAVVMQWGGGGWFGTGELRRVGDWNLLDQSFVVPGGQTFSVGHIARAQGDERVTEQYDIPPGQGVWRLNNTNTWRRVPADQ